MIKDKVGCRVDPGGTPLLDLTSHEEKVYIVVELLNKKIKVPFEYSNVKILLKKSTFGTIWSVEEVRHNIRWYNSTTMIVTMVLTESSVKIHEIKNNYNSS